MTTPLIVQIIQAAVDAVTTETITNVPVDDLARADVVKGGHLFQENPAKPDKNIYITISHGDPERTDYRDGLASLERMDNIAFSMPVHEVGGGAIWRRRFSARYGVFLPKSGLDEMTAMEIAANLLLRLKRGLRKTNVAALSDDEEHALALFITSETMFESGGVKKKTFIWRGTVWFDVFTERLYD